MDVTRYSDLSLKTVPTQHPIPPNSVACLYASYTYENLEAGTLFVLCRNKQELVITGPALKKTPDMEGMWEYDIVQILNKTFAEYLTIIVSFCTTFTFDYRVHCLQHRARRTLSLPSNLGLPSMHNSFQIRIPRVIRLYSTTKNSFAESHAQHGHR